MKDTLKAVDDTCVNFSMLDIDFQMSLMCMEDIDKLLNEIPLVKWDIDGSRIVITSTPMQKKDGYFISQIMGMSK